MSLLGDIFDNVLSGDEDDLERVIDGREYEEPDNEEPQNEEEKTGERVEPKKKVVRNPKPKLDPDRLRGPRGLSTLEPLFNGFKYKGKGHEKEDLDQVMRRLEHWCHRLYPKFQFDDCLEKLEKLGSKKVVQTYVKKIRLGMVDTVENEDINEDVPLQDEDDETSTPNISSIPSLTEEELERIERNRLEAQRRLRERQNQQTLTNSL